MSINATLSKQIQKLIDTEQVFVYYRKAGESTGNSFTQQNTEVYHTSNFSEAGFVMTGFDLKSTKAILIPLDKSEKAVFEFSSSDETQVNTVLKNEKNKENHIAIVAKAIAFIKNRNAEKIVISRTQKQVIDRDKIGEIYIKLLQTYPNAMVYIWQHPKIGLWLGATPEKLVQTNNKQYKTMALAGTQQYKENCTWKTKEIDEQQFVTDYVTEQLKPISENINIGNSHTVKAGHLAHIRTDISGKLSPSFNIKNLINQLHPTPAVCGTPREAAKDFIIQNEGYNRLFYTGFLGELNLNSKSDLSVNLRCLQVLDNKAILYIGGGITKDSDPKREWEETQNKAKIIRKIL